MMADDTPERAAFAALRLRFHALLEEAPDARAATLARLAADAPALAAPLGELLAALDERDLAPQPAADAGTVGPFRLLRRLGQGGMGEVFLAERAHGDFVQHVALKRLPPRIASAPLIERFARERDILAHLHHPGIAHLIDGGIDAGGAPWIAMEFVDGRRLDVWLRETGASIEARVDLVRAICAAVAFAHRSLVIHRDLKPANILIDAGGRPKLLDFGIAKWLDDGDAEATRTQWRALSLRYAAPEQVLGERTTTATDVYALGVLLYELVAGRSPYPAAERGEASWATAILADAPAPLSGVAHRRVGDLARIAAKAMAKSPAERYAGVAALADDLEDWSADRPLRSGIGSRRERLRQRVRRHRWPLLAACGVLLALGIGLVSALREARIAERQTRIAQRHVDALIGVLGAVNPQVYAGTEPRAGEFLLQAAATLERGFADEPALLRRALGEIGHGLLNLGHGAQAEPVLIAALAALQRDGEATPAAALDLYKLLVFSQGGPESVARAEATAAQIARIAAADGAPPLGALDALGSAGGTLSALGRFDQAERLFAQADDMLQHAAPLAPGGLENFWRQRGWSAWRAWRLEAAADYFTRSAAIMDAAPERFAPLRRAETQALLAAVELARDRSAEAARHLQAATPAFEREYPPGHVERAKFDLERAALLLRQQRPGDALARLDAAVAVFEAGVTPNERSLRRAHALRARSLAGLQRCDEARQTASRLAEQPPRDALPRDRALDRADAAEVARLCGDAADAPPTASGAPLQPRARVRESVASGR
ncbi:MAG: serine/threonine protein kinase [Dokdonella sp.]|nr:serine/threonine protein kinase [Dokdonella sp.]